MDDLTAILDSLNEAQKGLIKVASSIGEPLTMSEAKRTDACNLAFANINVVRGAVRAIALTGYDSTEKGARL